MAGGAASTVITKSGTNQLRGSAFFFHNQDELNANTLLQQRVRPDQGRPVDRNIYGGTLGGPIVRNRLFYFGSWERYPGAPRRHARPSRVPTAKMRSGDFSEVAAAYPTFRLFDPFTGGAAGAVAAQFSELHDPGEHRSARSRRSVMALLPGAEHRPRDLNSNQLARRLHPSA